MNRLFEIDLKDYKETDAHYRRPSARGIIFTSDHRIALVYSTRYCYYKFPGGGIRADEDRVTALIREVSEEVGMTVIPESIREYGSVLRLQKSDAKENTVFEQENYYYFCDVAEDIGKQHLDPYEAEAGFELRIVTLDEAIAENRACTKVTPFERPMIEREARVLELLKALKQ